MKETLFPAPKIHGLLNDIREVKFAGGVKCLHCNSRNLSETEPIVVASDTCVPIAASHSMI